MLIIDMYSIKYAFYQQKEKISKSLLLPFLVVWIRFTRLSNCSAFV